MILLSTILLSVMIANNKRPSRSGAAFFFAFLQFCFLLICSVLLSNSLLCVCFHGIVTCTTIAAQFVYGLILGLYLCSAFIARLLHCLPAVCTGNGDPSAFHPWSGMHTTGTGNPSQERATRYVVKVIYIYLCAQIDIYITYLSLRRDRLLSAAFR